MFAVRFVIRSYRWGRTSVRDHDKPVIVYGAGRGGQQLVRALMADVSDDPRIVPVSILDDDPLKKRWRLHGLRVRGGLDSLEQVVEATGAKAIAVAIPSIDQVGLRRVQQRAEELDLEVLVLPTTAQLLRSPRGADLRRLNLEDLLGRRPVQLDTSAIAATVTGKVVLVTGAGGSIGSELCRQISRFGPARLVMLDRDESALHAVQMSLTGRALLDDGSLALCDIRDPEAVQTIFDDVRPDIVFHAAALKHLTLLEQFPLEAWKTNVLGSRHVLAAAQRTGVSVFVNISTDKAADPTCVLGYSKRVAERLTADYATHAEGTYVSVRFGNVLGSRGSVLTAFTEQIERGGPVTVTHPDVERYFMLIPEACQLVLQAAAIGNDGEVMVLDMGTPVKIAEVARQLISMSGRKGVEIVYTGLRPGEKMSEALFSSADQVQASAHSLVNHVTVPHIDADVVASTEFASPQDAREWMVAESRSDVGGEHHG
jgi:FlaA1/EpsC-like NDP-sugar epimerase